MRNTYLLQAVGFCLVIGASPVFAQESARGRLADGRAFRTDSQGIQLVDQVAELQVTVDTLKRQLEASENEVALKNSLITEMQASSQQAGNLNCPPQPHLLCPEMIAGHGDNQEIHQAIVEELQKSQAEALSKVEARAQSEITAIKADLEKARSLTQETAAQADRTRAQSDKVLEERYKELSVLRAKLKIADEQIALYKSLNANSGADSARASVSLPVARGSAHMHVVDSGQPAIEDEKRVRGQAAAAFKKNLKDDLAKVREMLRERDTLFQDHAGPGHELQIRPSLIQTSQNRTIDQLEKDIDAESSLGMLGLMSREVREMKEKISDDVALIRRVGKL